VLCGNIRFLGLHSANRTSPIQRGILKFSLNFYCVGFVLFENAALACIGMIRK
jgi:hypothetical protein